LRASQPFHGAIAEELLDQIRARQGLLRGFATKAAARNSSRANGVRPHEITLSRHCERRLPFTNRAIGHMVVARQLGHENE
jgi:hypothetical protein